jgi:hypothetical protein
MDVITTPDGKMVKTGLEKLLNDFNVEVGDSRIMQYAPTSRGFIPPLLIAVVPNPRLRGNNPVAQIFYDQPIEMYNARPVRPRNAPMSPDGASYQADSLLLTLSPASWAEDDLRTDSVRLLQEYHNNLQMLRAKVNKEKNIPVAVAVSENVPVQRGHQSVEFKPRLIVVGDSSFASNSRMEEGSLLEYSLFASCLAWLRERPEAIGIEPRKRDMYELSPNTDIRRMIYMPLALMSLGVIGLGLGVWVVRRR